MFQVLCIFQKLSWAVWNLYLRFTEIWFRMDIKNQKEGLIYFHLNILGIEEILLCMKTKEYIWKLL